MQCRVFVWIQLHITMETHCSKFSGRPSHFQTILNMLPPLVWVCLSSLKILCSNSPCFPNCSWFVADMSSGDIQCKSYLTAPLEACIILYMPRPPEDYLESGWSPCLRLNTFVLPLKQWLSIMRSKLYSIVTRLLILPIIRYQVTK